MSWMASSVQVEHEWQEREQLGPQAETEVDQGKGDKRADACYRRAGVGVAASS